MYYLYDNQGFTLKEKIIGNIIIICVLFGLFYLAKRASDNLYEACMAGGVASEETCRFEAYYR